MPVVSVGCKDKETIIRKIKQLQRAGSPRYMPSIVYLKTLIGWKVSEYDMYLAKSVSCKRPNFYEGISGNFEDIFSKEELDNHLSYVLKSSLNTYDICKKFSELRVVEWSYDYKIIKKDLKDGTYYYSEILDKADDFWSEFVEVSISVFVPER